MKKFLSEVFKCSCNHSGQDGIYGKGNRLFNRLQGVKSLNPPKYRCTVCGKEHG